MRRVGLRRKRIPTQLTDREATIMEYFEPKIDQRSVVRAREAWRGSQGHRRRHGRDGGYQIQRRAGLAGKHQETSRHERHQRERRQPAHRRADDDPRDRNQRARARKAAGALGSGASVRIIASAQHGNHRRQHLPRFAVWRNPGATARAGSKGKCAFSDGEKSEPFTSFFQGPGKISVRRERYSDRNRRSLSGTPAAKAFI